ncbi:MAG: hypothetical protein RIR70_624, partial [Pseudomonadota bacterium]
MRVVPPTAPRAAALTPVIIVIIVIVIVIIVVIPITTLAVRFLKRLPEIPALQDTPQYATDQTTDDVPAIQVELTIVPVIAARAHAIADILQFATTSPNLASLLPDLCDFRFSARNGCLGQLDLLDKPVIFSGGRKPRLLVHCLKAFLRQRLRQDSQCFLMRTAI